MISAKAKTTAARYCGVMASEYDRRRSSQEKWRAEEKALRAHLDPMPAGTSVLDCPCGTGRFFPYYVKKGFCAAGVDVSADMLKQAEKKGVEVKLGDVFALDFADGAFDVAVVMRFMNLIEAPDVKQALGELQRVSRMVIFGLREGTKETGNYHSPHQLSLIEESLVRGWRISDNHRMHQEDYRLIVLCAG